MTAKKLFMTLINIAKEEQKELYYNLLNSNTPKDRILFAQKMLKSEKYKHLILNCNKETLMQLGFKIKKVEELKRSDLRAIDYLNNLFDLEVKFVL